MQDNSEIQQFDVNEFRDIVKIPLLNKSCSFFYDETGNVRKFRLTQSGVNAPEGIENDFILGGVMYLGDVPPCKIENLRETLQLSGKEMKFKTIAGRGSDFWTAINKEQVLKYLKWLSMSGLYVHYATINNIYYSVVDLVDSLFVTQPEFDFSYEWTISLKAAVGEFARCYTQDVLNLFYKYEYPDLKKDQIRNFCFEFSDLIQAKSINEDFFLECFRQMLKTNGRRNELFFIENNTPHLLIEEYSSLRITRVAMFKESTHYFDQEPEAEISMSKIPLIDNGELLQNYKFIDSKDHFIIQISDVLVGLLGSMFVALDKLSQVDCESKMKDLTPRQKESILIINDLIDKSDALCSALIQNVNSHEVIHHRGILLEQLSNRCRERKRDKPKLL